MNKWTEDNWILCISVRRDRVKAHNHTKHFIQSLRATKIAARSYRDSRRLNAIWWIQHTEQVKCILKK
jgi:hypothetical protein